MKGRRMRAKRKDIWTVVSYRDSPLGGGMSSIDRMEVL